MKMRTLNTKTYAYLPAYRIWAIALFSILFFSCGPEALNDPIGKSDSVPQKVTVAGVENISGGAIINYNVPKDNNVSYIEAVYTIKGKEVRKKGSFYTDELLVDGFPESGEYPVSLYSVSFSEIRSEPVVVTVSPEKPPYRDVAETMDIQEMFGGVKIKFSNPTKANLQITILENIGEGKWTELQTEYTSLNEGFLYIRDLENREYTFGVVCRDRWKNTSDTLTTKATPWYEELADVTKIKSYPLPTDISYEFPEAGLLVYHNGAGNAVGGVEALWNGETIPPFNKSPRYFFMTTNTSIPYGGLPASITIDLGVAFHMSRFVYWPRPNNTPGAITNSYIFGSTHVKKFELWGSNNPSPDGSYDSWTKIGSYESRRPSGELENTEDDKKVALTGENFDMPEDIVPYRYIRYKVFSTWGAQPYWASSELQFYGVEENN